MKKALKKYQFAGVVNALSGLKTSKYSIKPPEGFSLDPIEKLNTGFQYLTKKGQKQQKEQSEQESSLYPKSFEKWLADQDLPPGADNTKFIGMYNQYLEDFGKEKGFTKNGDKWQKEIVTEDKNSLGYNDFFKGFNVLLDATQLVAGTVNDMRNQRDEKDRLLKAQYPKTTYNTNQSGINNIPVYYKNGGQIPKGQPELVMDMQKMGFAEQPPVSFWDRVNMGFAPQMPNEYNIKDTRKISATTGKPVNPNKELLSGKYPSERMQNIVKFAKLYDVDPYTALAMDLQETGFGTRSNSVVGHAIMPDDELIPSKLTEEEAYNNDFDRFMRAIVTKQQYANKLGIKDPAKQLQVYNGWGMVYPETEQWYHGFKMNNIYGVPVPKTGLDLRKNPLYGKRILDIKENVLKKDKDLGMYIGNIKKTGGQVTQKKAKEILKDGTIHGKKLTEKQRGYFGFIAGGGKPKMQDGGMSIDMLNNATIMRNQLLDEGYYIPNYQEGGYVNNTGYLDGAATSQNPYNIIPSNTLTMQGVSQDIMAYPNVGEPTRMKANDNSKYTFPNADYVLEVPVNNIMRKGGKMCSMCGGKMPCKCGGMVKMQTAGERDILAEIVSRAKQSASVPQGYSLVGKKDGRTYYGKTNLSGKVKTLPRATSSKKPTDKKEYDQTIINLIQQGFSPDELVEKKYITPENKKRFEIYYKPQTTSDYVFTQEDLVKPSPIQSFSGEPMYLGSRAFGASKFLQRKTSDLAADGSSAYDVNKPVDMFEFRKYKPNSAEIDYSQPLYRIPAEQFHIITGGTRQIYNLDELEKYKVLDEKQFGGPLEQMATGGIPQRYKNMGFTKVGAKKKSNRAGKKWMVLAKKGDKYKVVHGGYVGMEDYTQHKDKKRQKNFWNRMGGKNSAKATDPFSPLYWHKRFGTWQEGGQVDEQAMMEQELMAILQQFAEMNNMSLEELMAKLEELPEDQRQQAIDMIVEEVTNQEGDEQEEPEENEEVEEDEEMEEEEEEEDEEQMQNGGVIQQVGGVPRYEANAELEKGEVYQDNEGMIKKVSEREPMHEDGGSPQPDVHRVLEDTADKRRDLDSRLLKIKPEEAEAIIGFKPKKATTHSKLFEEAAKFYDGKAKAIEKKIKQNYDYVKYTNGGKYAQNSLEENLKLMSSIPTKADIFDIIYNHQETVKGKYGIGQENQQEMRVGGLRKFQTAGQNYVESGYQNQPAINSWAPSNQTFLPDWYKYWVKANTPKGGVGPTGVATTYDPSIGYDAETKARAQKYGITLGANDTYDNYAYWRKLNGKDFSGPAEFQKFVFDTIAKEDPNFYKQIDNIWGAPPAAGRLDDAIFGARTAYATGWRRTSGAPTPGIPVTDKIPGTPVKSVVENKPGPEKNPIDERYAKPAGAQASTFSEPLRWFDVAGTVSAYTSALEREPVGLEQLAYQPLRARELNPLPTLMQNQADYNAALGQIPTSGAGMANIANLQAQKYAINNQVLGQYENQNKQLQTQMDQFNLQNQMNLDRINLGLRDQFAERVLKGKEVQRQSKLNAFDDYLTKLAQNRKLNREGNLMMQLTPYMNQYGQFNGQKFDIFGAVDDLNSKLASQGFTAEVAEDKKSIKIKDKTGKEITKIPSAAGK